MKNTNTYILPEHSESTRIFKPFTLRAIMRTIFITDFHCNIMQRTICYACTDEGQSSIRNEGDIGL